MKMKTKILLFIILTPFIMIPPTVYFLDYVGIERNEQSYFFGLFVCIFLITVLVFMTKFLNDELELKSKINKSALQNGRNES